MIDLDKVVLEFENYVSEYDHSVEEISLKHEHSYQVMKYMEMLACSLQLDEEDIFLSKTIGLLHDIGRFEQMKIFSSFSDKNQDHADESCNYLFKKGHIRDFCIDRKYDDVLEVAILYHNKYELPNGLTDRQELFAKMIRDMDKVDIYNQVEKHYHFHFKQSEINQEALTIFRTGKSIPKNLVKSSSDKVLVYFGFLFDIYFQESFEILKQEKSFDKFLSCVKVDSDSKELWHELVSICYQKIKGGKQYVRKKI